MSPVAISTASRSQRPVRRRDFGLVAGVALCSGLLIPASLPGPVAGASAPLAAIFPPWMSGEDAVARILASGARVVRQGALPFIVVLAPETPARPSGALLMLRLDGLAGCIISPKAEADRL